LLDQKGLLRRRDNWWARTRTDLRNTTLRTFYFPGRCDGYPRTYNTSIPTSKEAGVSMTKRRELLIDARRHNTTELRLHVAFELPPSEQQTPVACEYLMLRLYTRCRSLNFKSDVLHWPWSVIPGPLCKVNHRHCTLAYVRPVYKSTIGLRQKWSETRCSKALFSETVCYYWRQHPHIACCSSAMSHEAASTNATKSLASPRGSNHFFMFFASHSIKLP
jgi:hypothetical protein